MMIDYHALKATLRGGGYQADRVPQDHVPHAVCLVLFDAPATTLLLIQKADHGDYEWRDHVALPGGRIEASDRSAQDAALRELHEELGISPSDVDVLGNLGHFQTDNAKNDLEVLVTHWPRRTALQADEREIARVLVCPLGGLVDLHQKAAFRGRPPSAIGDALIYELPGARVWGVTARIIYGFLELLFDEGLIDPQT